MSEAKRVTAPRPPFDLVPPLHVYYPEGGRRFLLNWSTDDDRGHVVVARSEAALDVAFRAIVSDEPEIHDVCEVEIVAPPARLCLQAAKLAYEREVENFMSGVAWRLRDAVKAGHDLPRPFCPCARYEPREQDPENVANPSTPIDQHYDCVNCCEGIRMVGMTREELHARCGDRWRDVFGDFRSWLDDECLVSRARQARDDEAVRCAIGDYGHHRKGVYLADEDKTKEIAGMNQSVLFYFLHVRHLDRSPYLKEIEDLHAKRTLEREQAQAAQIKEMLSKKKEDVFLVCRFFRLVLEEQA